MRVIVTGATGFLGTALCAQLEQEGHQVVRLSSRNCDLTRAESLEAFSDATYDRIYHLAAWTQAGDFCLYHPGEQWLINQRLNTHVLAWWQQRQPQAKLIALGSSCAYAPEAELAEDNYLLGLPIPSLFTYAMTKRMLYVGLLALHQQYGLNYLCLVPSTLYGPGYHTDARQMHFIFDLIRKILRAQLHGEPVVLWGDGHQTRELVYVEDFVRLALELDRTRQNDLVNIGAGQEFSIRHFAQLICQQVGYDFQAIQFDPSRYVGARSKCLSPRKLRQLVPDAQFTPLEIGLARTIAWFQTAGRSLLAKGAKPPAVE
jgi:GDP-L-fucose synthase